MDNTHNYDYARNHARCVPSLPPFPSLTAVSPSRLANSFDGRGDEVRRRAFLLSAVENTACYTYINIYKKRKKNKYRTRFERSSHV